MAFPTNYWTTFDNGPSGASGNKDDILNFITMVDPFDTPFLTSAPRTDITNTFHFWFVDALAATSTAGACEGDDFDADALSARIRLQNVTQIFRKDISVSDTQRAVNPIGIRDEYEYQVEKAMKELARNLERRVWSLSGQSASGEHDASPIARVMASFADFLTASSTVVTANAAITTALVNTMMEQVYTNGGNPDTMYVSPGVKADFSAASNSYNTRNIAASDKRVIANVDVYESDFGLLAVIPDRWMRQASASTASADVFLVERSKARIGFLRPFRHVPIGKGGDSTRGFVRGEVTLEILHPSAHIRASGITT